MVVVYWRKIRVIVSSHKFSKVSEIRNIHALINTRNYNIMIENKALIQICIVTYIQHHLTSIYPIIRRTPSSQDKAFTSDLQPACTQPSTFHHSKLAMFFWNAFIGLVALLTVAKCDILHALELDLAAIQLPESIIQITNANLLIISRPDRDHFTLLVLTSSDEKHNCEACLQLKRILPRVVSVWYQNYPASQYLYFAEVDIVDRSNVDIFNHLRLREVPQVWLIPPSSIAALHEKQRLKKYDKEGNEYFENYDILQEPHAQFSIPDTSLDDQVFKFADWLAIGTLKLIVVNQENPIKKFGLTFGATLGTILLIKKRGPSFITNTITKGRIYQVVLIVMLLLILGGYSFTTIQQVPFIAQNDKGVPIYISGGLHYQFGVEMLLVAFVYFSLAAALVVLVYLGNYKVTDISAIKTDNTKALMQILAAGVLYLLFSWLTSIFLRKSLDYPFPLLKVL